VAGIALGDAADCAAARGEERQEDDDECERSLQGYDDGWMAAGRLATASSRVP
jgi:hypothetical protein